MANDTHATVEDFGDPHTVTLAIVLPTVFAVALIVLLAIAFLLPECRGESNQSKQERRLKRLGKLDSTIKAEHFVDWAKKEGKLPPSVPFANELCVICLEEFEDTSNIRGLGCHHVFHQQCLDDWFGRWHDYCPLCHRRILPGEKKSHKKRRQEGALPVAFIV